MLVPGRLHGPRYLLEGCVGGRVTPGAVTERMSGTHSRERLDTNSSGMNLNDRRSARRAEDRMYEVILSGTKLVKR